jgi:ribosome-associated heat shock protein Hsp15
VSGGPAGQRADKWLVFARFFKTRAVAAAVVEGGHLRVNGVKVARASHAVGPGDVLTFVQGSRVRVVRVESPAARRGPPAEARALYTDMDGPPAADAADRSSGAGA